MEQEEEQEVEAEAEVEAQEVGVEVAVASFGRGYRDAVPAICSPQNSDRHAS